MSRQRKNLISLIVALIAVGGLGGVYFWQSRPQPVVEYDEPDDTPYNVELIQRPESDIVSIRFTNNDGHDFTMFNTGFDEYELSRWVMADAPDVPIYQSMAREMARAFHMLTADERVAEAVEDPSAYGIGENITATATYMDGSQAILYVGMKTPDLERYYMMLEGDPDLYLLYGYYGDRYLQTAGDLVDRNLPWFVLDGSEYLLIREKGQQPLEFSFIGTQQEKEAMYEEFGMVVMTMISPYYGRDLYYYSLENVMLNPFFADFKLGELVELFPNDYAQYGLDDPDLEFKWIGKNADDELHLLFGNRTDNGMIYVKLGDRPEVFLAEYNAARHLYGANPYLFIERFVALIDIQDVESIAINYPSISGRNVHFYINHIQTEESTGIAPTVNGVSVDDSKFRKVYQQLISFTTDMEIPPFEPSDPPVFTVTFNMRNGEPQVKTEFYLYEVNFLAMSRNGEPCNIVTSKQEAESFFAAVEDLMG